MACERAEWSLRNEVTEQAFAWFYNVWLCALSLRKALYHIRWKRTKKTKRNKAKIVINR